MSPSEVAQRLIESKNRICSLCRKHKHAKRRLDNLYLKYETEVLNFRQLDRLKAEHDGRLKIIKPKKERKASGRSPKAEFTLDLDKLLIGLTDEQKALVIGAMKRQGLC